jgi:hypothetical protein
VLPEGRKASIIVPESLAEDAAKVQCEAQGELRLRQAQSVEASRRHCDGLRVFDGAYVGRAWLVIEER